MVRYIALDNSDAAFRFGSALVNKFEPLKSMPRMGRIVREYQNDALRELVFPPYRLVYEVNDDFKTVFILRIWHGARGDVEL